MANINKELNKIKNAVYGREVRQAIHDSIKKTYDDAAENGNANMEVVMARGTENTLGNRLDKMHDKQNDLTSQLNEKVNLGDVYDLIGNLSDATPSFAENEEQMTDVNKVYVNTEDGYIYIHDGNAFVSTGVKYQSTGINGKSIETNMVNDGSITPNQTNFMWVISDNLLNKKSLKSNTNINETTGEEEYRENRWSTGFENCKPNTEYSTKGVYLMLFYQKNGELISYSSSSGSAEKTHVTPSNASFYRAVILNSQYDVAQINKGELKPYDDFSVETPKLKFGKSVDKDSFEKNAFVEIASNITTNLIVNKVTRMGGNGIPSEQIESSLPRNYVLKDGNFVSGRYYVGDDIEQGDELNFIILIDDSDVAIDLHSVRVSEVSVGGNAKNVVESKLLRNGVYYLDYNVSADNYVQLVIWNNEGRDIKIKDVLVSNKGIPLYTSYNSNKNIDDNIRYVSPTGNDANDGLTPESSFKNIQKAFDDGGAKVYLEPGDYINQTLSVNGVNEVEIKVLHSDFVLEDNKKPPAKFINAEELDVQGSEVDGIYQLSYNVDQASNWYKVFISKTLNPKRDNSYNAILWECGIDKFEDDKRLEPVLSISDCKSKKGSFFYDGNFIYINPTENISSEKRYMRMLNETGNLFEIKNSNKVVIEDLELYYGAQACLLLENCNDSSVRRVVTAYSAYISGNRASNTNVNYYNCMSYKNDNDGFSTQAIKYADANYYDCISCYNYDDGLSHHHNGNGHILGGEFYNNSDSGIVPALGSKVNIHNVITYNNYYGIRFTSDNSGRTGVSCNVIGSVSYDNQYGLDVNRYNIKVFGSNFENNLTPTRLSNTPDSSLTIL